VADPIHLSDDDHAALAALADDRLADGPAAALRGRIEAEPQLAHAFAADQWARSTIRDVAVMISAPLALRECIETAPPPARRRRPQWLLLPGAAAGAIAVTAAAILIAFGNDAPTVTDTLAAASRAATVGVSINPSRPQLLTIKQDAVTFPNFAAKFSWRGTGARKDTVQGRDTTTVTYRRAGESVSYTIVSGEALDEPDGRIQRIDGRPFIVLRERDRTVVTWTRDRQTCVLSSSTADADTLVILAAWKGRGTVRF
jgi:hypothetical protein